MKITISLFEACLKCTTKCFLRSLGETGTGTAYADWIRTQAESYRHAGMKGLLAGAADDECITGSQETNHLKTTKWRLAIDLVIRAQNLESSLLAVERAPSEGRGQPGQFTPIRFVFTNKLNRDDKLLLAFDTLVLSEMLGRTVDVGKIIHGTDHAIHTVRASTRGTEADQEDRHVAIQPFATRHRSESALCRVRVSNPVPAESD